jgi:ABC-type phosphate/phosphonate transport system permease subunit
MSESATFPEMNRPGRRLTHALAWAGGLALLSWAWSGADMRPLDLFRDSGNMAQYSKDFFPPNFRDWRIYLEEIVYGVIPQVLPLWISYSLYRFEANVRSASVVGMVGAGGIGVVLYEVIRGFHYAETSALLLIIIAFVSLMDLASARIRRLTI